MSRQLLKLFILGYTPIAKRAIKNLDKLCNSTEIKGKYSTEIINLYERPEYAEQEKILATPLLLIKNNAFHLRLIGDLSNSDKVLEALHLGMTHNEKC